MTDTKIKVGITGQAGFIGSHLYHTLALNPDFYDLIEFRDEIFEDQNSLDTFVSKCDIIMHLAAMNRHPDPNILYKTNMELVEKLILAMESTESVPHVLFASSIQEDRENHYGLSKKNGRLLLEKWALENDAQFTAFLIPNVYGPFGQPNYNSVVATFCHKLTHGENPEIINDGNLQVIYIGELVSLISETIKSCYALEREKKIESIRVPHTTEISVTSLLSILYEFKHNYFEKGILPNLSRTFTKNLFNTFVCYIDHSEYFPYMLKQFTDSRGSFVETARLNSGGQVSFSTTVPGITRGNHYHTRKAERFVVLKGRAKIELRKIGTSEKTVFLLDGEKPSFVDMPIWHTHNITNIGDEDLYTLFWINEQFDPSDPDTYFEKV